MLLVHGTNPNKGSPDKSPLTRECLSCNVELVDMLLKHGADPNVGSANRDPGSQHKSPLFIAVDRSNIDIITSLLNAGANVNAMNHKGRNVVCFAAEMITNENYYLEEMRKNYQHCVCYYNTAPTLTCNCRTVDRLCI